MIIIDYPDRITEKQITEEGQKRLRELQKIMQDFMKEHDVHLVKENGDRIIWLSQYLC